jgi:predicted ATPase
VDKTREHWYEAELHRLKGELSPDPQAEAEASFRRALEIARRQQAKSLELRVATSLARLWQEQGKKAKAWRLLSKIYGWFTEGFDRKDLQEAKAMLDRLS